MTEAEWHDSDDTGAMLDFLWLQHGVPPSWSSRASGRTEGEVSEYASRGPLADLQRSLHRYYLASCRGIWKLLPQEESRRGIELAERFLVGAASAEELQEYNWYVEGAAFCIDYDTDPEAIDRWVAEVQAMPEAELRGLIHPPEAASEIEPRELLRRAAYFADYAMIYPSLSPKGPPPESYRPFLSATVLRQHIGYPADPLCGGQQG